MKFRLTVVAAAASALALSACGSPAAGGGNDHANAANAAEVYQKYDGLTGDERMTQLVEEAEEEGTLSFYTTLTSEAAEAVEKAFEATYDIDVVTYRASSEDIIAKVNQEQGANYAEGSDVLEMNGFELVAMNDQGFLADFGGPERDAIVASGQAEGWTADRINRFVATRNTDLMPAAEWPERIEDFADPKYEGKLSLEANEVDWFMALYDYYVDQGMSEDEALQIFEKISANSRVVAGHSPQLEQLSSGQFAAILSMYDYQAQATADAGAPVSIDPLVEPVVQRNNGVALMKSAPHPAAAYLFTTWILTDGQDLFKKDGLPSALASEEGVGIEGKEVIDIDLDKLLAEYEKYSDLYQSLLHQ